jgi:hypothetical protein
MAQIDIADMMGMVRHWLRTPPNGYLGSGYGADVMELLQRPMLDGTGDALIQKMRQDIPLLDMLPSGSIYVWLQDVDGTIDQRELIIQIADQYVTVTGSGAIQ